MSEKQNVMAWGSHIEGAVQLTKLRGKKQLRTKTGLALFLAVRSQMVSFASGPPVALLTTLAHPLHVSIKSAPDQHGLVDFRQLNERAWQFRHEALPTCSRTKG